MLPPEYPSQPMLTPFPLSLQTVGLEGGSSLSRRVRGERRPPRLVTSAWELKQMLLLSNLPDGLDHVASVCNEWGLSAHAAGVGRPSCNIYSGA